MSEKQLEKLDEFIEKEDYLPVAETLAFSVPEKKMINKNGTDKKRVIYLFPEKEVYVLKLLTWLLYKYDKAVHPRCYSFRRNLTAKDAFRQILRLPDLENMYVLKTDIHDYFNSIPTDKLSKVLETVITDDHKLLKFLISFFSDERISWEGNVMAERRGAMAGVPLSSFAANIYLTSLDHMMSKEGIEYYRYSDDIIMLSSCKSELEKAYEAMKEHIEEKGLTLNEDKTALFTPGEPWDFLGFRYEGGKVELAESTMNKIKGRIRRKARSIYRWKMRKGVAYEKAAKALIKRFNRKFYDSSEGMELTWSRWFFPVLTGDKGLQEIDHYFMQYIRYVYSGRHYKGNYDVTYEMMKSLGYRSLVHEFHRSRKTGRE